MDKNGHLECHLLIKKQTLELVFMEPFCRPWDSTPMARLPSRIVGVWSEQYREYYRQVTTSTTLSFAAANDVASIVLIFSAEEY